jgi:hypothetical protein
LESCLLEDVVSTGEVYDMKDCTVLYEVVCCKYIVTSESSERGIMSQIQQYHEELK